MTKSLATIIRVQIEEGKEGLFYATSPDLRGLLVAEPDMEALYEAIPVEIANHHEVISGSRPVVIQAGSEDLVTPRWVSIPRSIIELAA